MKYPHSAILQAIAEAKDTKIERQCADGEWTHAYHIKPTVDRVTARYIGNGTSQSITAHGHDGIVIVRKAPPNAKPLSMTEDEIRSATRT